MGSTVPSHCRSGSLAAVGRVAVWRVAVWRVAVWRVAVWRAALCVMLCAALTAALSAWPTRLLAADPLECVIEPNIVVEVSSAVDGVVENVLVGRAEPVKRGQVLAELESDVEVASLALARARAEMDSEVKLREVALGFDDRRKNRAAALYQTRALSAQEKEQVDAESRLSGWRLRKAKDDKLLARLEADRAAADLERRTIRSPVDGVVVERFVGPGETVEDQPLYQLATLDPLNIEVIVPVSMYGQVTVGMTAEVVPEDPVGGHYQATVEVVDRVLDAASGTFGVRLTLANPGNAIPAGLRCEVSFQGLDGQPARRAASD